MTTTKYRRPYTKVYELGTAVAANLADTFGCRTADAKTIVTMLARCAAETFARTDREPTDGFNVMVELVLDLTIATTAGLPPATDLNADTEETTMADMDTWLIERTAAIAATIEGWTE